jgi:Peptidase C13 family
MDTTRLEMPMKLKAFFAAAMIPLFVTPVLARDYFLTIGGGGSAGNNQVSLEKNVQYFQRVLAERKLDSWTHDIYFADGNDPGRDVQYVDPRVKIPRVVALMARVFDRTRGIDLQYRDHQLGTIRGESSRGAITEWFDQIGSKLRDDDRLLIYFTGHGGRGSNPARNTTLGLWPETSMAVKEFTALLDKVPAKVPVTLVMVQCYSGGFADTVFKDAKPGAELAAGTRCGFFATVHDRTAAGCTPDISEENYHEYSTDFWAAISGRTRLGEELRLPDYNGDGRISFSEAHAYVQLTSNTTDIPICTSDTFLRSVSKTKDKGVQGLLTGDSAYEDLAAAARPEEKAVIDGLSKHLNIWGNGRTAAAKKCFERLGKERSEFGKQRGGLNREYSDIRREMQSMLKARWPELTSPWHPETVRLMTDQRDAVIKLIESHPRMARFDELEKQMDELDRKSFDLEREQIKCQRLMRVLENVALAANLPKVAGPEVVERYEGLIRAESATMGGR